MNKAKILFALACVAFCCILGANSLKCYTCNTVSACKSPKKEACSTSLGNATRDYLNYHYTNNNQQVSNVFDCMSDTIKNAGGETQYKGCVYRTTNACSLCLKATTTSHTCNQCSNKDYCNPAGRPTPSTWTWLGVTSALAVALALRF